VLVEQLRKEWRTRETAGGIRDVISLEADGLVLGAGTILAGGRSGLNSATPDATETEIRLLTLLCAAYGRSIADETLSHINHAAKRWREGQADRAAVHLALTRLDPLPQPRDAARRLFMADGLMRAGVAPDEILKVLGMDATTTDLARKFYNPQQPRAPTGVPTGGQWTRIGSFLARLSASDLAAVAASFGRGVLTATRFTAPPAVFFGVLFIPMNKKPIVTGQVLGHPGLGYGWNQDETTLHLAWVGPGDALHVKSAHLGAGGMLRDPQGKVVGRVLPDESIAVDLAAVSPDLVDKDEPNLCPKPTPDRPGGNDKDRDYEDYVKRFVNPDNPTPRGFGVALRNFVGNGNIVVYDDCQRSTGTMIEAKGTTYAKMILESNRYVVDGIKKDWLNQSLRQVQASQGRPILWYFAEPLAAQYAHSLFETADNGRGRIQTDVLPWKQGQK
jgi:hypothetical protein